jgi:hypothetical protein
MKKMMTKTSISILKALLIVDIVIILISVIFFDIKILWNTQIGFISASLVMLASMKSYQRMVDARVELNIITIDDTRDTIDKLEDEHDLYSEDIVEDESVDMLDAVKDEKLRMKKNKRTLSETIRDTKAALSLNRIGAYIVLILGFFYLNRHELLMVPLYILALSVPMLVVVFVLLSNKENQTEDTLQ